MKVFLQTQQFLMKYIGLIQDENFTRLYETAVMLHEDIARIYGTLKAAGIEYNLFNNNREQTVVDILSSWSLPKIIAFADDLIIGESTFAIQDRDNQKIVIRNA